LTERQHTRLSGYPDMVLQFAHFLDYHLRNEGLDGFEIRAHVWASLNSRKMQLLIDPNANLALEQESLMPASWILPLDPPVYHIE
jgi:vitamin K-dependent gamma-carboxylase